MHLQIALFTKQLTFPQRELNGMKQVSRFVSFIYVDFWHEAIVSPKALKKDFEILELLKTTGCDVQNSAFTVAKRHIWYPSGKKNPVELAVLDKSFILNKRIIDKCKIFLFKKNVQRKHIETIKG